jgi:uncharacterized protein (DUF1697 family)
MAKPANVVNIALLRGINVGGRNMVAMADLRMFLEALGFSNARTLLQSGNMVFSGGCGGGDDLERLLERHAAKRLALQADFVVRTADEWADLVRANPFRKEAEADPAHLIVMALKSAPDPDRLAALRAAIKGRERAELVGKQAYLVYPDGMGHSKLTGAVIEKALGTRGTCRNWNTVLKIERIARPS